MASENHLTEVPSWVPDLRYLFDHSRNEHKVLNYISFSLGGRKMVVKGVKVDSMTAVFRRQQCSTEDPESVGLALQAFESAILQPTSKIRNTSMDEIFHEWLERLAKAWLEEHATLRITALHCCYKYHIDRKSLESEEISDVDLGPSLSSFVRVMHTTENFLTQGDI